MWISAFSICSIVNFLYFVKERLDINLCHQSLITSTSLMIIVKNAPLICTYPLISLLIMRPLAEHLILQAKLCSSMQSI